MSGIFDQVINYAPPSLLKGTVTYKGTWSAATNTPTLINPPDSTTNGFYYVVSAAGTQFSLSFNIGDWIISNGSAWEKVDNTDAVSSVFGRTGAVVGVSTDYSAVGITATAVGASSPSTGAFTTLSATTPLAVASGGTGVASSTGTTNVVLSGSPTITTPVIAQINDANGNETLKLASIASAVNEVTIENAATGNAVHISATGGDASVGLHLAGKGASGYVNVQDSTDATKRIMFNASGGTTNTRTMLSSTQTVDRTISLPDATDTLVGVAATQTLTNKTLTSPTLTAPVLGTPASGTVTNLTGTASININGTVGATTPSTVAATLLNVAASTRPTITVETTGVTAKGRVFHADANAGGRLDLSSNLSFDGTNWQRDDTGEPSSIISLTGGLFQWRRANTGSNPASLTTIISGSDTGLAVTGALSATGQLSGKGTATNDNAAAGFIGEYVESVVASASAVSLTTNTAANVTSISLTAGDWDIYPIVNFTNGATTVLSLLVGWVSTTSATLPSSDLAIRSDLDGGNMVPHRTKRTITPPSIRISLSGTTTVYLEAYGEFTVSTLVAFGAIRARRVR